jgi:3-dehydro-L-gulonate 2-dehydrogenase
VRYDWLMLRIPADQVHHTLKHILTKLGFAEGRADLCARLFVETTRDGVYSHGLNRFPRFVATIRNGVVDVNAQSERVATHGVFERWDGRRGPGNLNAWAAMERAIGLARVNGVGAIALANTNHWMRGGTYGWQAADAGVIGICWTNTMPNLPPWGSAEPRLGNNPLIFAVPRNAGAVVLDMAMSQFSYGALASYRSRGEMLPVDGGFDREGNLTRDPAAIEESFRALPIGYWKGSGLALMLDMVAALLAGGQATCQIAADPLLETGISQVFLTFDVSRFGPTELADRIVASLGVRYPGEQVRRIRAENLASGLPVEPAVWEELLKM